MKEDCAYRALLEWPAQINQPRITNLPTNTADIFPTILDIVDIPLPEGLPIDGMSLLPLIQGELSQREKPMGFWHYPVKGIRTPSKEWMAELWEAQQVGNRVGDSTRLRMEAGALSRTYSPDSLIGHAAWLDWPWKLHRIEKPKERPWSMGII